MGKVVHSQLQSMSVSLHKEGLGGKDYWHLKLGEVEICGTSLPSIRNDEKLRQL